MAISTLIIRIHESKASYLGLLGLFLLIQNGSAFEFIVGGSKGWAPSDSNALNQWAESKRFQVDDSLVFNYAADQDSVLYVTKDDYTNCNTAYPINKFTDGRTVYKFNQSGPHYFISGNEEHCRKNEKLVVIVLADRRNKYGNSPPPLESNPSPPPYSYSPPPIESIPPPTYSNSPPPLESNPSPPPTGEQSPDTPSDMNPPTSPHKNGAAALSSIISSLCSIGALLGSSLVLVL